MKRPSKNDIKASVDKLKEKRSTASFFNPAVGKLSEKKSSLRIRKQGI